MQWELHGEMMQDIWERLEIEFAQFPILKVGTVTKEEIDSASLSLGIPFPEDYREFLLRYGGAIVGPYSIFGLRAVEPMGNQWSVTEVNQHYRAEKWPGVEKWLVISRDHAGNPMGIEKDGRVLVSDHDTGDISPIASSFEDFIRRQCLSIRD